MKSSVSSRIVSMVILIVFAAIAIYPVLRVMSVSMRTDNAFQSRSLALFEFSENYVDENGNGIFDVGEPFEDENSNGMRDRGSSFENYFKLFTQTSFLRWTMNSLLVSLTVTLLGVALASMSGYALSRFQFTGRRVALLMLMTTQMFPATMLLLPFFIMLSQLKLMNNFWGLIIVYSSTALPFCIWQMKGYYDTIPVEIEEAARLDGCSQWTCFYRIVLPLSAPALVITALFSFLTAWSEYVVAAVILQDPDLYTLPLGLKSFQSSLSTEWGLYAAGSVVVSIPVVAFFISISKYLISGLTLGGIKG